MTVDDRTINSRQDKCAFIRILATTITIFYTPFIFPSLLLDGFVTCHRAVRRHTRSPVTRRSTRATQAQAAPKFHSKRDTRSVPGPRSALGSYGRDSRRSDSPRFVTICHAMSRFGRFGWPFRHPGCTPRLKHDLGELYMTQTRPDLTAFTSPETLQPNQSPFSLLSLNQQQ